MAFDDAIDYMKNYRTKRGEALDNAIRQRWFTSELSSLPALYDTVFDSGTENTDWKTLDDTDGADISKLQAHRLKIAWLAGCRRDLRVLFASWTGHRERVPLDADRYEYMRLIFGKFKLAYLKLFIEDRDGGLS